MNKRPEEYWYIYGQAYDLKTFSDVHPGGKEQLLNMQGRDCTEMVHSMHALASMEKVKQVMEKYRVGNSKNEEAQLFAWKEDGLYETLRKRTKEYINSLGPKESHKSNNRFWILTTLEIMAHGLLYFWWIYGGSVLCALVAGMIATSLGFMLFHTGGHCGLSKNPKVNMFWYKIYANYVLGFISKIWDLHHNYGHHCYTNIHRKDPDVNNAYAVIRKSEHQNLKPIHKAQWYTAYLLLVFYPGQWYGQVIQYFMATRRRKIFGLPMIHKSETDMTPFYIFFSIFFGIAVLAYSQWGFFAALLGMYLYSFGLGLVYWGCTFPNHDTDLSEQSNIDESKDSDWGEHQIRHSANFKLPQFLSFMIGGMNYQIEHHLFPAVHPRHYPAVSKIVKEECQKRNVPYHEHTSWFDALAGNFRHLRAMSKKTKTH
jgi:fatty acid desaturase